MEEEDIAAAMGFSSFGGQKRKFDQTNSPKAQPTSSGANSTRLGVRTKTSDDRNAASVSDSVPESDDAVVESTEAQPRVTKGKATPKPPAASSLADFLARGQTLPDIPSPAEQTSLPAKPQAVPSTHVEAPQTVSFGGPPISTAELAALRNGVPNDQGDIAYFLPSFVEDPWEKLRKTQS
jgi:hypothetical protein